MFFLFLFVCLLICLFVVLIIMGNQQEVSLKFSWRSDLIWLRYIGSKKTLFVCLFVCLYDLFVFCFNHSGTPTESSTENFVKIRLDLAEILTIRKLDWKMIICLFVCFFTSLLICFFFVWIILGHPHEVTLKICEDLNLFGWDI